MPQTSIRGQASYRLIRYAGDFLVVVSGGREHAEQARDAVAAILAPMGLRLSAAKTMITHVDEGFDLLGWRIQRRRKRGPPSSTSAPTLPAMARRRWCWRRGWR
ncbi:hypothetical protein [Amycolatopsis sp. NPDC004079]|uniref:hypothetical protein n=1 Tax=Amycolatopsis sp. NPDC004079 TaxID=3154549 RepID=UPI0033A438DF